MRTPWLLPLLLWAVVSCTPPLLAPPELTPADDSKAGCEAVFPKGKWQFVHSIEFTLADGQRGNALGVSVIDGPIIDCVIMTLEGFVLFEARLDGDLAVKKAVPPFTGEAFARGLLADIQLIFTPPPHHETQHGLLGNGEVVCRYQGARGELTDVILHDQGWEIDRYTADRKRTRTVQGRLLRPPESNDPWQTPSVLELTSHEPEGYHLRMNLVSATRDTSPDI